MHRQNTYPTSDSNSLRGCLGHLRSKRRPTHVIFDWPLRSIRFFFFFFLFFPPLSCCLSSNLKGQVEKVEEFDEATANFPFIIECCLSEGYIHRDYIVFRRRRRNSDPPRGEREKEGHYFCAISSPRAISSVTVRECSCVCVCPSSSSSQWRICPWTLATSTKERATPNCELTAHGLLTRL